MGASGLVFAGILENEDLPPDPDEEEKDKDEEEKVEEEEDDEDEDSASDESGDEEEGDGKGKKKKIFTPRSGFGVILLCKLIKKNLKGVQEENIAFSLGYRLWAQPA